MAAFTPVSFPENDFEVVNQESSDSCVEAETKLESSTGSFQVVETAGQVDLSGQPIIASLRVATISHETTAASAMIVNETCSSNPEIAQDERGFVSTANISLLLDVLTKKKCRQVDIAAIQNMTILRSKPSVSIEVNSSSAAICEEIAQGSDVASLYKIANSIDHDEAENEQINHPGHVLLNRHIYTIYGPGVLSGDKLIGPVRVGVESINCPYWKWPLYNDFKEIRKETKESLPPPYVNLQDWHILQIHYAGVSGNLCGKLWPADFNSSGVVRKNRKPKGRAGKVRYGGAFHYAVVFGDYQLSGDEASQVVVLLPPNTDAIPNQLRTTIGTGQLCEAEEEFEPTFEELRHGMYTSRLREPALQRRPLNNCGNWGPENRNGQPPSIKVIKKVAAKEKHKNPALEDASKTVPKTKKGIANRVQRNQPAPNNGKFRHPKQS